MELTAHLHELIIGVAVALGSGGLLGAWFTHTRDLPKARAEARNMDWQRFQTEITRLDKKIGEQDDKLDSQEKRIEELETEVATCHITKEIQALQLAKQESEIGDLRKRLAKHERAQNG
jgi:septal ring factor EnvC (AmiA/AmiB activator)